MNEDSRQLLRYIYAEQLILTFRSLAAEVTCNGCEIDHPSQWQHSCIDPDSHLVSTIYKLAAARLNKGRLKAIFLEAAEKSGLDCQHIDLESTLREYLDCWVATSFQDIERSFNIERYYARAIATATSKIDSLERRFTKV